MNKLHMKLCACGAPIFLALFFIAFCLVADLFPPHEPSASADAIAALYQENTLSLRFAITLALMAIACLVPFTAASYFQLRTLEGSHNVLSMTYLISGIVIIALFIYVISAFATTSFRPDRAAEITQIFNDFAWISLIWVTSILLTLYIPVGLLVLSDQRQQPLFPRWYGFYCFWVALLTFSGAFCIFFKTGPFAWDGLVAFWIPLFNFFPWYLVTAVLVIRSIDRLPAKQIQPAGHYHAESMA